MNTLSPKVSTSLRTSPHMNSSRCRCEKIDSIKENLILAAETISQLRTENKLLKKSFKKKYREKILSLEYECRYLQSKLSEQLKKTPKKKTIIIERTELEKECENKDKIIAFQKNKLKEITNSIKGQVTGMKSLVENNTLLRGELEKSVIEKSEKEGEIMKVYEVFEEFLKRKEGSFKKAKKWFYEMKKEKIGEICVRVFGFVEELIRKEKKENKEVQTEEIVKKNNGKGGREGLRRNLDGIAAREGIRKIEIIEEVLSIHNNSIPSPKSEEIPKAFDGHLVERQDFSAFSSAKTQKASKIPSLNSPANKEPTRSKKTPKPSDFPISLSEVTSNPHENYLKLIQEGENLVKVIDFQSDRLTKASSDLFHIASLEIPSKYMHIEDSGYQDYISNRTYIDNLTSPIEANSFANQLSPSEEINLSDYAENSQFYEEKSEIRNKRKRSKWDLSYNSHAILKIPSKNDSETNSKRVDSPDPEKSPQSPRKKSPHSPLQRFDEYSRPKLRQESNWNSVKDYFQSKNP